MFSEPLYQSLDRVLDASAARQRLLASNLANIDTPGYRSQDLDFEAILSGSLEQGPTLEMTSTGPGHMGGSPRPEFEAIASGGLARRDGNDVNLDREMAKLAETSLMFQAGSAMSQAKFHALRNVITGGR